MTADAVFTIIKSAVTLLQSWFTVKYTYDLKAANIAKLIGKVVIGHRCTQLEKELKEHINQSLQTLC